MHPELHPTAISASTVMYMTTEPTISAQGVIMCQGCNWVVLSVMSVLNIYGDQH